jgi:chromosome segregation ATPase
MDRVFTAFKTELQAKARTLNDQVLSKQEELAKVERDIIDEREKLSKIKEDRKSLLLTIDQDRADREALNDSLVSLSKKLDDFVDHKRSKEAQIASRERKQAERVQLLESLGKELSGSISRLKQALLKEGEANNRLLLLEDEMSTKESALRDIRHELADQVKTLNERSVKALRRESELAQRESDLIRQMDGFRKQKKLLAFYAGRMRRIYDKFSPLPKEIQEVITNLNG